MSRATSPCAAPRPQAARRRAAATPSKRRKQPVDEEVYVDRGCQRRRRRRRCRRRRAVLLRPGGAALSRRRRTLLCAQHLHPRSRRSARPLLTIILTPCAVPCGVGGGISNDNPSLARCEFIVLQVLDARAVAGQYACCSSAAHRRPRLHRPTKHQREARKTSLAASVTASPMTTARRRRRRARARGTWPWSHRANVDRRARRDAARRRRREPRRARASAIIWPSPRRPAACRVECEAEGAAAVGCEGNGPWRRGWMFSRIRRVASVASEEERVAKHPAVAPECSSRPHRLFCLPSRSSLAAARPRRSSVGGAGRAGAAAPHRRWRHPRRRCGRPRVAAPRARRRCSACRPCARSGASTPWRPSITSSTSPRCAPSSTAATRRLACRASQGFSQSTDRSQPRRSSPR